MFIVGGLPGFFSVPLPNMFSEAFIGAVSLALIVSTVPESENMNFLFSFSSEVLEV